MASRSQWMTIAFFTATGAVVLSGLFAARLVMPKSTPTPVDIVQAPDAVALVEPEPEPVEPVNFDIQGMKIGDKLIPQWAFSRMVSDQAFNPEAHGVEEIDLGGYKARIHYQFDESRLVDVAIYFDPEAFPSLVRAYTNKFQTPPHEVKSEVMENLMGASIENTTASWHTTDGPFTISKYSNKITEGCARIASPQGKSYWARKARETAREMKNKL